jgi:hemerythrin superfamily protein
MDPFTLFRKDHANIRALLDKMMAAPPESRKEKLLDELQQNLYFHLDCEERFLFSRLLRLGETRPLTETAAREHQAIREGLQKLQNSTDDQEREAQFRLWRSTILDHLEEEEDGLYEEAREVFDESLLRTIANQLREVKRERLAVG